MNKNTLELLRDDSYLEPYEGRIRERIHRYKSALARLSGSGGGAAARSGSSAPDTAPLVDFAAGHLYYGMHRLDSGWVFREWAPFASEIFLIGDFSGWIPDERWRLARISSHGDWELKIPEEELSHGTLYRLLVRWPGGEGERIPAWTRRVIQDPETAVFSAQIWHPSHEYPWKQNSLKKRNVPPLVYEVHVGMSGEDPRVSTFEEFRKEVLPRIVRAGYNTIQFMALMEHPYYGSFGYQVSSFFALSSRFGTPEEFKALVDECHARGIAVIMDLVHSHAVKNEVEGISRQDGSEYQYFHQGGRGMHPAWDSRCFDYGKDEVLHFLLSNCAFWMHEYRLDGFRFDGVTSMLYRDHGLGVAFDHYDKYFSGNVDEDAFLYLALANSLIHRINPEAVSIAEDMSGMPGLARAPEQGGCGFDYRLTLGIPDYWIKLLKERPDEHWDVREIWGTLNNRRFSEKHISYSESHDQALVGDKTLIFRLMDAEMYSHMSLSNPSLRVDRGMAIIKIINLLSFSLGGDGYMCFMGNEFGHPEWIDFPREGNQWSYHYARRQWSLLDHPELRYRCLAEFDRSMLSVCSDSLKDPFPALLTGHGEDQVLCYRRSDLIYAVNLNPSKSFTDYGIPVAPGTYRLVLNSDSGVYNGFSRVPDELELKTAGQKSGDNAFLPLYLPSRTALVFRRTGE